MKIFSIAVVLLAFTSSSTSADYLRSSGNEDRQLQSGGGGGGGGGTGDRDRLDENDLNFRFNKFTVPAGVDLPSPLTARDYPIRDGVYKNLKKTDAVSVINQSDYEVDMDVRNLINSVGGLPSYPMNDENAPYWEELREVIEVQDKRINDANVFFQLAKIWEGSDLGQIAEYVHNEYPGIIQSAFLA